MAIRGIAVAYTTAGGLILFSGIKGATISSTVKAVLGGSLNVSDTETVNFSSSSSAPGTGITPNGNPSGTSAADAEAYAASILSQYGWGQDQMPYLLELWTRESGWSEDATNPSSGAYGIAQALPETKYPAAGQEGAPDGTAKMEAQIGWGLNYIKSTYGSPEMAWAHEQANGWY